MRPHEMHPRVLRELFDGVAKSLSMILEKSWQVSEITVTGKRETLYRPLKRTERNPLGATNLSASPLCHGTDPSRRHSMM